MKQENESANETAVGEDIQQVMADSLKLTTN